MTGKFFIPPQKDPKIFHTPHLPSSHLHPCLTDPREVRNLRGEGPPQDRFAWGELEGDICVGMAWGLRGDGSVTKGLCVGKVYCEQVCVGGHPYQTQHAGERPIYSKLL